jgi:hypothetical protein
MLQVLQNCDSNPCKFLEVIPYLGFFRISGGTDNTDWKLYWLYAKCERFSQHKNGAVKDDFILNGFHLFFSFFPFNSCLKAAR